MEPFGEDIRFKPSEKPVDKLERDRLPPALEIAEAEYFADMAFDDRLLALLEDEPATISIYAQHTTDTHGDGLAEQYFKTNTGSLTDIVFEDSVEYLETPAFAFGIEGQIVHNHDRLQANIVITPESGDDAAVQIESDSTDPDVFCISKSKSDFTIDSLDIINTTELFTLLCQLEGARKSSIDAALKLLDEKNLNKPADMRRHVVEMWERIGEAHGKRTATRTLSHAIENPISKEHPETITLVHEEIEEPQKTTIKLHLNHATKMPELNVTDVYSLRLVFEQSSEVIEKHAERTVKSDSEPTLVSAGVYRQHNGRTTKLDIEASAIKELFVDWFDQLISA